MAALPKLSRKCTATASQARGRDGEDKALLYLTQQGLALVERNFRCRGGEIDLVMRDREELVFVEVRARSDNRFGGAAGSITAVKRARLILAAQIYLQRYRSLPPCRFDVIALQGEQISWLKNVIES